MTTKRSAYGFTVNPDEHWSHAAACAGGNPDMWFSGMGAHPRWHLIAEAIHICRKHCPVRSQCREEIGPLGGAVVAGVFYNEKGRKSDYQPIAPSCARCTDG
jgi:hypothetical protein